jgi:hypothetical protein
MIPKTLEEINKMSKEDWNKLNYSNFGMDIVRFVTINPGIRHLMEYLWDKMGEHYEGEVSKTGFCSCKQGTPIIYHWDKKYPSGWVTKCPICGGV